MPPEIQALIALLLSLPGIEDAEAKHTPLEEFDTAQLSLVSFGDLPHAVLLRTNGGLRGEALGQIFFDLKPELKSWRTLEFLSWQVRDCSRTGKRIQIRSRGLPPYIGDRIQLGTTLRFILEFFVDGLDDNPQRLLSEIADFTKSLQTSLSAYQLNWEHDEVAHA
jgi:hypothetical protein